MSINWDVLGSVATFSAVILALLFGFRDVIDRRRNRPTIVLEHRSEAPYVKAEGDLQQLNLKVTNKGRVTARNLNLRIQKIVQNGKRIDLAEFPLDFCEEIPSLRSGDSKLVPLLQLVYKDPDWIEVPNTSYRFGRANSQIDLLVVGDNIVGVNKSFRFVELPDSKFKLEENKAKIEIEIRLVKEDKDQKKNAEPALP
jgi:hypothetical protein